LGSLIVFTLLLLTGCGGSGGGNRNGGLTLTTTKSDNGNSTTDVTFALAYANSQVTDYQGLGVAITAALDGVVFDTHTEVFASSGKLNLTYAAIPAGSTLSFIAKVGDLEASTAVFIAASNLSVSPSPVTFTTGAAATTALDALITGGIKPYSVVSDTTDITVTITGASGNILHVVISTANAGATALTATLTVSDSSGKTVLVPVSY